MARHPRPRAPLRQLPHLAPFLPFLLLCFVVTDPARVRPVQDTCWGFGRRRFAFYRHARMEVERGFWHKRMQTTTAIMGSGYPRPTCMIKRAPAGGRTRGGDWIRSHA
eukprot:COSAG05_NODE_4556_length_1463_cov_11.530059_2_plen_108_part_00